MTLLLEKGRYRVRRAQTAADVAAALSLRRHCFAADALPGPDDFDHLFEHILVECAGERAPVATFRVLLHQTGAGLGAGYLGAHFGLAGWRQVRGRIIEMGRFCLRPGGMDPDVVRAAWAGLARLSRARDVGHLVGTTTFGGLDPAPHAEAFRTLYAGHLGPGALRPGVTAPDVVAFSSLGAAQVDEGTTPMPGLLRSYLRMGGWVGDHAVVDRPMRSLHVFTALDLAAIPARRKRSLLALAGE